MRNKTDFIIGFSFVVFELIAVGIFGLWYSGFFEKASSIGVGSPVISFQIAIAVFGFISLNVVALKLMLKGI